MYDINYDLQRFVHCKLLLYFKFDLCDHNPSVIVLTFCFNTEQEYKGVLHWSTHSFLNILALAVMFIYCRYVGITAL